MWLPEALIKFPPAADNLGLVVRPLFSGSDPGILTVQLASGSFNIGSISGSFSEPKPGTAGLTFVLSTSSEVIIASGNLQRMGLTVFNDSSGTLFLMVGPTGSLATNFFSVKLSTGDFYELPVPVYTGAVTGLWNQPDTSGAMVTEYTP